MSRVLVWIAWKVQPNTYRQFPGKGRAANTCNRVTRCSVNRPPDAGNPVHNA